VPDSECRVTSEVTDEENSTEARSALNEGEAGQVTEDRTSPKELEDGANSSQSASSEGATFSVTPPVHEETNPDPAQSFPVPASTTGLDGKQPVNSEADGVEQPAAKVCTKSATSPRVAAIKTDVVNKRTTPSSPHSIRPTSGKDSVTAAAGKRGGAAGKSEQKQSPVSVSNGAKKTTVTTTMSKKTSLDFRSSADKAMLKPSAANRQATRTYSDTATLPKQKAGDVGGRPASRLLKTKK